MSLLGTTQNPGRLIWFSPTSDALDMKPVDFHFDYLSPYAYLASVSVSDVCKRQSAVLHWRPVLFPALLNHWGQRGPAEIPPKSFHSFKDCLRHARSHGIPFRAPKYHPFNPLPALRVTCSASSNDEAEQIVHALYALGWAQGGDLGDVTQISRALAKAGLPGEELIRQAQSTEVKQRLRQETEAAIARGVFGVPTMIVGDELFWGLDQLKNLELHLAGNDPIAGLDWSELIPQGASAWRPGVSRHVAREEADDPK